PRLRAGRAGPARRVRARPRELAPGVGPRARRDPCRVAPCRARAAGRRGRRRPLSCAAPRAPPGPRGLRGPSSWPVAWFAPAPALPRARGRGCHGSGGGWAALLFPPHAGEGRDGGRVRREALRRSGRTSPPPQPSTADGGRGATGVEAAGQALLL